MHRYSTQVLAKSERKQLCRKNIVFLCKTKENLKETPKTLLFRRCCLVVDDSWSDLIGFDHETAIEAQEMEALEANILRKMGVPNPYKI